MSSTTYTYQSDFAKRYYNQGREEGISQGVERGREEGLGLGEAQALLMVLESRGLTPDPIQRERILSAKRDEIETWLRRAATIESIEELLATS